MSQIILTGNCETVPRGWVFRSVKEHDKIVEPDPNMDPSVVEHTPYGTHVACAKGRLPYANRRYEKYFTNGWMAGVQTWIEDQTNNWEFKVCDTKIDEFGRPIQFMTQHKLLRLPLRTIENIPNCGCNCGQLYYAFPRITSLTGPPNGYYQLNTIPPKGFIFIKTAKDIWQNFIVTGNQPAFTIDHHNYYSNFICGYYSPELATGQRAPIPHCPNWLGAMNYYKYVWTEWSYQHLRQVYPSPFVNLIEEVYHLDGWQPFGFAGSQCYSETNLFVFSDRSWARVPDPATLTSVPQYTTVLDKPFARTFIWTAAYEHEVEFIYTDPTIRPCDYICKCPV